MTKSSEQVMEQINKIIIATIITGSVIIGSFIYLAIRGTQETTKNNYLPAQSQNTAVESSQAQTSQCQAGENTVVTKVIDGDTVVVEGGYHVRLLGIDADEKGYLCYDAAKNRLEALVLSKQVILQKDITDVDQYKRCLRTIFLGSENIDLQLVKEGLAIARFYEPAVAYKSEIQAAEKQAIESKVGCKWSK